MNLFHTFFENDHFKLDIIFLRDTLYIEVYIFEQPCYKFPNMMRPSRGRLIRLIDYSSI